MCKTSLNSTFLSCNVIYHVVYYIFNYFTFVAEDVVEDFVEVVVEVEDFVEDVVEDDVVVEVKVVHDFDIFEVTDHFRIDIVIDDQFVNFFRFETTKNFDTFTFYFSVEVYYDIKGFKRIDDWFDIGDRYCTNKNRLWFTTYCTDAVQ